MKAAVFLEAGRELSIQEVPEPQRGPSDLILEVKGCGVCGSDLHAAAAPNGLPAGTVMGHEFVGVVAEVGPEAVGNFKPGDRVVSLPCIGCGACSACLTGDIMHCGQIQGTGLGQLPGAFAERVRVGSNESIAVPDAVDDRSAALVEPLSVGLNTVRVAGLQAGQNVLVIGAGPIGLSVALWAHFFGARSVVVSEMSAGRRELAGKLGASHLVDASSQDVATAFAEHTGGAPDVIFECVGIPGMLMQCIGLAPSRGKVVVAGVCIEPDNVLPVLAILKELQFNFVLGYQKSHFEFTLEMLASDRIRALDMVTQIVDLPGLPASFEALKTPGDQCKVVVEP